MLVFNICFKQIAHNDVNCASIMVIPYYNTSGIVCFIIMIKERRPVWIRRWRSSWLGFWKDLLHLLQWCAKLDRSMCRL